MSNSASWIKAFNVTNPAEKLAEIEGWSKSHGSVEAYKAKVYVAYLIDRARKHGYLIDALDWEEAASSSDEYIRCHRIVVIALAASKEQT